MCVSEGMRTRVTAPDSEVDAPTGDELADRVLEPVAAAMGPDVVRVGVRVCGVARIGRLKHEEIDAPGRAATPFRLLLADETGAEWNEPADVVVDTTGSYGRANPLGDGGLSAPGEAACADRIVRTIPGVMGEEWSGTTLPVGGGKSAQNAARDLAGMPGARVVWAVRDPDPDWGGIENDTLPTRHALVDHAVLAREGGADGVEVRAGVVVDALRREGDGVVAALRDSADGAEEVRADRVLALTGYVGDPELYRQLQVHECYATGAPMNLAAPCSPPAGDGPADCLAQPAQGVDVLRSPEPDFFVLGMKSYGRSSAFLLRVGFRQVDQVVGAYLSPVDQNGGGSSSAPS